MSTLLLFFKKTTVLQHSKECIILYFFTFVSCDWFQSIHIRIHIRLLDPCFKTGRLSVKWIGTTLSHLNRIKIIVYHFDICSIMLNYYICFSFLHLVFGEIQHIQFMNWFQNASIYRTITWSPKTFNQEFLVAIKKILESCIENHDQAQISQIIRSNYVISGLFWLYFQSAFHLSLAVLLCYQFSHCI